MNTPETPEIKVLALSPPRLPEATTPVIGAHYGVPKHVYDLKPMGLRVDIDPPLAGTIREGDAIKLKLNDVEVEEGSKTINPGEENSTHTLYIKKGLRDDKVNELVYDIVRGSANVGTSTPVLTLLYNKFRPGKEDRTPGDGAHSELELILPEDVREDGIDAERAKQRVQVCCAYPYCRPFDRIWLNCNGQDVYHTVSVSEAPAIPSSEPTTICVMVEEEVFQRAGNHPEFAFSYTVHDQLGNGPDTDSPWSGVVKVNVDLTQQRLAAPDVTEDPDDANDDPDTIDLGKLGSKDLTVQVHTFAPLWQPNDLIRVSYSATPSSGPIVRHSVETTVARVPFIYKLLVPNAKVIADSVVRVKYELVRSGKVLAASKTTIAQVTGASADELLPPFLVKPAVSPIDISAYPDGVTVRIEFLGALPGEMAQLKVNPPAGAPEFPLVKFNANKRVNTVLTANSLEAWQGENIELSWSLNRDGEEVGTSPPLKLSILPLVVPTLTSVKGSPSGVEIPDGGTTIETALTLTGTASKGKQVGIFDGSGPSAEPKGTATADSITGEWRISIIVPVGVRRLYAQSLYHPTPTYSNVRNLTVAQTAAPTISSVKGSPSGVEIPNGGTTVETAVTLTGTASKGLQVEIFDGNGSSAVSKGLATADHVTAQWSISISVPTGARRLYAKSLYHQTPTYSNVRTLTVAQTVAPTISSVRVSSSGVEIPHGSTTTATAVTLSGTASNGQQIEVFDGTVSKGKATVNNSGVWTFTLSGLALTLHSLTAKALYGTGASSAARTFTITALVAPTITEVKASPSNVVLANGATTTDRVVILTGAASKGLQVEIFDGAVSKGKATVNGSGVWTFTLSGLALALHSLTAKALYGTGASSAARTFTVAPPLSIITTPLVLAGPLLVPGPAPYTPRWDRTHYIPPGATGTRVATGGVPPYTYASANPAICTVNASTGVVVSASNGTTDIVVTDSRGTKVRYPVQCSGVYELLHGQTGMSYDAAMSFVRNIPRARVFIPGDAADNRIKLVMYLSYQKRSQAIAVSWGSQAPASGGIHVFLSTRNVASWPPAVEVRGVSWEFEYNKNRSYYPLAIRSKG